jgi:hypothetical protein
LSKISLFLPLKDGKMKLFRHLAYVLLICFSAFLGHNLVPHHHHSEVYLGPVDTDCPFEHEDQHGHGHGHEAGTNPEEHPIHCHAFNDVVFKKYNAPLDGTGSGKALGVAVPLQVDSADVHLGPSALKALQEPPCCSYTDMGTRTLRAPPALA